MEIWSEFELPDSLWTLMQTMPLTEESDFGWPGGHFERLEAYDARRTLRRAIDNVDLTGVENWWHKGWLPLMQTASGDFLCLDTVGSFGGKPGQILEHHCDLGPRAVVYDDFDCYLSVVVEGLERGYFHPDGLEEELEAFEGLELQDWDEYNQLRLAKVSRDLPVNIDIEEDLTKDSNLSLAQQRLANLSAVESYRRADEIKELFELFIELGQLEESSQLVALMEKPGRTVARKYHDLLVSKHSAHLGDQPRWLLGLLGFEESFITGSGNRVSATFQDATTLVAGWSADYKGQPWRVEAIYDLSEGVRMETCHSIPSSAMEALQSALGHLLFKRYGEAKPFLETAMDVLSQASLIEYAARVHATAQSFSPPLVELRENLQSEALSSNSVTFLDRALKFPSS